MRMGDIKRDQRRTVYENRWMKVHENAVLFPNGAESVYGIVDMIVSGDIKDASTIAALGLLDMSHRR